MDCFICLGSAVAEKENDGDARVICDYCGEYRMSSVAIAVVKSVACRLNKTEMVRTLVRKRQASGQVPLLEEIDLEYLD